MNYSFIDNYKNNDFTVKGNLIFNYHNDDNKDIKNYNKYTDIDNNNNNNNNNNININNNTEKNNWATENSIQKSLLKSVYTPTPLGEVFFSPDNINRLQNKIKKSIFIETKGKYKLQVDQNESDLFVVMRAVYIQDSYNSPYRIIHQVKELNEKVINRILPDMITNIKQNEEYLNVIDKPIDPIPLPVNVSRAGRLSLPSITTIWN
jgi:hypothetical protein